MRRLTAVLKIRILELSRADGRGTRTSLPHGFYVLIDYIYSVSRIKGVKYNFLQGSVEIFYSCCESFESV